MAKMTRKRVAALKGNKPEILKPGVKPKGDHRGKVILKNGMVKWI